MDKQEAKTRFEKADRLYCHGRFEDALLELDGIEKYFPNHHRLLNAQARTLERIGHYERALQVCDRLLNEFGYERVRPLREQIAMSLSGSVPPQPSSPIVVHRKSTPKSIKRNTMDSKPRRFKLKPVRLAILVALCALMYFQYLPIWLGIGLLVTYVVAKFVIGRAIQKLFSAPFKMKGKALSNATCILHGHTWTEKPNFGDDGEDSDDETEDEAHDETLRYVWLDVTITPEETSEGFTHWEPGELQLAPAGLQLTSLDNLEGCYEILDYKIVENSQEVDDDIGKHQGPLRVKLLAGIPVGKHEYQFAYYFEVFGELTLNQ